MKHVLLILLLLPLAAAEVEDFRFTSFDGAELDARILTPSDGNNTGPWPAALVPHGWGGSRSDGTTEHTQQLLADAGYLVVSWTARGFGGSDDVTTINGPNEIKDAMALLDMLAQDERVIQEAPGDPLVGGMGQSYGGALLQLLAVQDDRIDAIVPVTTWHNLIQGLAPADIPKIGWISLLYANGLQTTHGIGTDPSALNQDGMWPIFHQWYAELMATGNVPNDAYIAFDGERSLHAGELNTPTLLVQGWPDTLFSVADALPTYEDMMSRGKNVHMVLFPGGHGGFYAPDQGGWDEPFQVEMENMAVDFLNRELLGNGTLPAYPVMRYRYAQQDYVPELQWPPAGTTIQRYFMGDGTLQTNPLTSTVETTLVMGQGMSCTDVPNFQSTGTFCPYDAPGDSQLWVSPSFETNTEITGTPEVHIEYNTLSQFGARLFFTLMEVNPDGDATPILRQTMPHQEGFPGDIQVKLHPVSHTIQAGNSVGVHIATSNAFMASTRESGTVTLTSYPTKPAMLLLPVVQPNAFGDRMTPEVTIQLPPQCANCSGLAAHQWHIIATDDWDLEMAVTLDGEPLQLNWTRSDEDGVRMEAQLQLPYETYDQLLEVRATDPMGKTGNASVTLDGIIENVVQEEAVEESPGFALLAAVAAIALALRRKTG